MLTVRKVLFAWQEKKEQKFLEEMAMKGYKLADVGFFRYTFEETEPCELIYQFDFKGLKQDDLDEYLQLYEDAGWEHVTRFGSWYYFCRKKEEAMDMSLFNDNTSKKEKYKRLILFLLLTGFPLYYQVFIMIPVMNASETLDSFYSWFRIIAYPLTAIHAFALYKIITVYRRLGNGIRE